MKFAKAHSLGNDFLFLDVGEYNDIPDLSGLALKMCDRHTGIGADGLLLVWVVDKEKGVAHFRIFNADGSEPEISGNGLRCAAAVASILKDKTDRKVAVRTSMGKLVVEWYSNKVFQSGPAEIVFEGRLI